MEATVKTVENANMSANRLSDLYESARQANYWSSFDPDRAARTEINGYEATLAEDLTTIPVEEQQEYVDNFKAHLRTIFARSSRIASPMVTGPAKFNYRRNEKANASYQNAIDDFDTWRARAKRSIARKVEAAKPQEQKDYEEWPVLRRGIAESLAIIKGIDEVSVNLQLPETLVKALRKKAKEEKRTIKELIGYAAMNAYPELV